MNTRYFGLDFARATLMLLGIVFHSSLIYSQDSGWHTSYSQHSYFFTLLGDVIHYFRMNAFYIIAGFFFVLVVEKYGAKKTLIERIIKLGVPLLMIGLTINGFISSLHQGQAEILSFDYISQGQWVYHLWFIGNLILYYLVAIWFVEYFSSANSQPHSLLKIAFVSLAVTPVMSIVLMFVGAQISQPKWFFITFDGLLGYFPYFVLGMYFWRQKEQVFAAMTLTNGALLSIASFILIAIMQVIDLVAISWSVYLLASGFTGAVLALAAIILLNCIGNKSSKLVSKLTESSYTVYLLHEPLIVFIFVTLLAGFEINLYLSFVLLCTIVLAVSYFSHFLLIKKSDILMFLLNGKIIKSKFTPAFLLKRS